MQKGTTGAQTGYPVFLDRRYRRSRYLRLRPLIPREAYVQSFSDVYLVIMWCFIAAAVLVSLMRKVTCGCVTEHDGVSCNSHPVARDVASVTDRGQPMGP